MPPPQPRQTVHLRRSPSPPDAASSEDAEAAAIVTVEGGDGVDLAQVGRALGLDPASVRLNGYFLSRCSAHVSLSVTWAALLAFFAARGLPSGADPAAPVAVHGRPAPSPPLSEAKVIGSSKRKSGLETKTCSKKSKLQHNSPALSELLNDDITLGLKRRLRLDEPTPPKKIKLVDYSSVNGAETQQPVKFSCSFINGHSKRLPDDEMVTSLPCKRVRTVSDADLSCRLRSYFHKSWLLKATSSAMAMNLHG